MASIGNRAMAKVLVAIAALSGCAPVVPGLEETLLPAASGAGSRGVVLVVSLHGIVYARTAKHLVVSRMQLCRTVS